MGRSRRVSWMARMLAVALFASALGGACSRGAPAGGSPEAVVRAYLEALRAGNFAAAYDLLTPYMVRDQGKIAWVAEQTAVMNVADVEINGFEIFPARLDGDKAIVPNLLKSKDKFINQTGADEYELYTLVRAPDTGWKIEQQQLVETDAIARWFPESAREKR